MGKISGCRFLSISKGSPLARRVVVTGLGMVSPCGLNVQQSWQAAVAGRSGVKRIQAWDPSDFPVQIAAEVKGFDPAKHVDPKDVRRMTRFVQLAIAASEEALHDAGYTSRLDSDLALANQ